MLPTFVGIGAQRSGTTWIHRCLAEHPQIFVPEPKEVQFFNRHFERGVAWYEQRFKPGPGQTCVGEISPNYLNSAVAIERMAAIIPDAKLFLVLREPVQRAFSAYRLLRDQYKGLTFREACANGRSLVTLGLYTQHLTRVYSYYPRHQVKVLLYDDLTADPSAFLGELFEFLGVDPMFKPTSVDKRYNRVIYPSTQTALDRLRLGWAIRLLKTTAAGDWLKRLHTSKGPKLDTELNEADIRDLKGLFRDDVLELQRLIGRDLGSWL